LISDEKKAQVSGASSKVGKLENNTPLPHATHG